MYCRSRSLLWKPGKSAPRNSWRTRGLRRLVYEQVESRCLLSVAAGLGSTADAAAGLNLLPAEAQQIILSAIASDQASAAPSASFAQQAKLTALKPTYGADLGYTVAIDGNTIVVGAPWDDINGKTDQGAAYVFVKPASGWADMKETAKLVAIDGAVSDHFGCSVAISGNRIVVGALGATIGGNVSQGAAYCFTGSGANWNAAGKFTASNGHAYASFGESVAISNGVFVVGSETTLNGNQQQGMAYIFGQNIAGGHETARLTGAGTGSWSHFSCSVAIKDNLVVVGSLSALGVFVYVAPQTGWANSTENLRLLPNDHALGSEFGRSVAIGTSGEIVVGDTQPALSVPGAVYLFGTANGWATSTQVAKLTGTDVSAGQLFGNSVAMIGDTVVVGAPYVTSNGHNTQGAAYVYSKPGGGWQNMTESLKLTGSDGNIGDNLGWSVAMSGSMIVAGARSASGVGAAYVFGTGTVSTAPVVTGVSPQSGPLAGGNTVTIVGTGFTGVTAVKFGKTAATIQSSTDTQVVVTCPKGSKAGAVDVVVTTPGGTSAVVAADKYTYLAAPSVSKVVVAGSKTASGPTAGGTTVTVTGKAFTGATSVMFGTAAATSFTVVSDTSITAISPAAAQAGAVNITVAGPGGTSAVTSKDTFTYTAMVTAVSPNQGPLAGGGTVTITGTGFTGVTAVLFGKTAAVIQSSTATQIVVACPAAKKAGAVDVLVAAGGATSPASAGDKYTYFAVPSISKVAVAGSKTATGPAAGGTTVTISGSALLGATAVLFGSTPATSFVVNSDKSITAVSPAGTGTVHITVTGPGGTSLATAKGTFTYVTPTIAHAAISMKIDPAMIADVATALVKKSLLSARQI